MENNTNQPDERDLQITPHEQKIMQEFMKNLADDLKDLLLVNLAANLFANDKARARTILENWRMGAVSDQQNALEILYKGMDEEAKKKVLPIERHMELFNWCSTTVKDEWENMLDIKTDIIITN